MTDEREERYETPPGYFGWPEGDDAVQFLDENGKPMTVEEMHRRNKENPPDVIGSGTKDDPYRLRGTEPHEHHPSSP